MKSTIAWIAWGVAVGALTPFGLLALRPGPRALLALLARFALLYTGVTTGIIGAGASDWLLWAGFAASGVACLTLLRHPMDEPGRLFWLWVVATSVFCILFAPFIAARPYRFYLSYTFRGPWSLSLSCPQTIEAFRVVH